MTAAVGHRGSIDARAFTVGNHVAFNQGEYDPSSAEGQHVLAHVRQQTQGAVGMLPQADAELEIDPDPALEREAEEAAQRAMAGGPVTVNRMGTEVHVQRVASGGQAEAGIVESSLAIDERRSDRRPSQPTETSPAEPPVSLAEIKAAHDLTDAQLVAMYNQHFDQEIERQEYSASDSLRAAAGNFGKNLLTSVAPPLMLADALHSAVAAWKEQTGGSVREQLLEKLGAVVEQVRTGAGDDPYQGGD